jgi:zinc protease
MIWYKVGSADETPGKSGLAHFLEHLMFKGTDEASGRRILPARDPRIGGQENAFTSTTTPPISSACRATGSRP